VFLEVVTDPEAIDDRQLVAFIRTDLDPMGALASLDQFDRSWWLEASHRSRGKMCIHLEFGSIFEPIPVKKGSKMWSSKEVRQ
jgi:hypothetical protein